MSASCVLPGVEASPSRMVPFVAWSSGIARTGGSAFYLQLSRARDEWLARLQRESRPEVGKLTDPKKGIGTIRTG
jgi:hypothetical protein